MQGFQVARFPDGRLNRAASNGWTRTLGLMAGWSDSDGWTRIGGLGSAHPSLLQLSFWLPHPRGKLPGPPGPGQAARPPLSRWTLFERDMRPM